MSRLSLLQHPAHGGHLLRLAWPMAVLFAMTLACVFVTVESTRDSANESAVERQKAQLRSGLAQVLSDPPPQLRGLQARSEAAGSEALRPGREPFDPVAELRREGPAVGAERIAAALGREIETLTPHAPRRFGIQD